MCSYVVHSHILEFRDCDAEIDAQWSIKWNKTSPKNTDVQDCPGEYSIGLLLYTITSQFDHCLVNFLL